MIKILIVGLMLVASGSVYSSGKEYSSYDCNKKGNSKTCEGCELQKDITVNFKVSTSLDTVMRTVTFKDGRKGSITIKDCKIFDDDTIACETKEQQKIEDGSLLVGEKTKEFIVANGIWSSFYLAYPMFLNDKPISELVTTKYCGIELK